MEKSKSDTEIVEKLCYYLVPALHCIFSEVDSEEHVGHLESLLDFLESLEERIELYDDDLVLIPLRVWDRYLSNDEKVLFTVALKKINKIQE